MKRLTAHVVALLALAASPAYADPVLAPGVAADIEAQGARATVLALDKSGQMHAVLDGIASGDAAWIRLAPALATGTDAGDSTGLSVALAHALPRNPRAVLKVLDDGPVTGALVVCGVPFIEPTQQEVRAYLKRTIPAVKRVKETRTLPQRAACLEALERTRAQKPKPVE